MSSIIEGYNYDVFISFKQKDNLSSLSSGRRANSARLGSEFIGALKSKYDSILVKFTYL